MSNQPELISLLDSDDEDVAVASMHRQTSVASRVLADGVVEILDDSDGEGENEINHDNDRKPAALLSNKRRTKVEKGSSSHSKKRLKTQVSLEDEDLEIVAPPPPPLLQVATVAAAAAAVVTPETDVQVVGSTGLNALVDFPHARENCVQFPFSTSTQVQHCSNCFCFVCDVPASQCATWQVHCHATYTKSHWKQEREKRRRRGSATATQPAAAAAHSRIVTPALPTLTTTTTIRLPVPTPALYTLRAHLPVRALLDAVTRVYPVERTPPPPFRTQLRHYQKQSLAFMMDVEDSGESWKKDEIDTRGGWLCSEVGMGKSAVVIALVAAKPFVAADHPKIQGRRRVKSTVIMTSVSLIGQWEDECKKHAPHLKVVRYHPSSATRCSERVNDKEELFSADIVVSSATFDWESHLNLDLKKVLFHRVVMDESHLLSKQVSACPSKAGRIPSAHRWCVTATPMISSTSELYVQMSFLGMNGTSENSLVSDANVLEKHMIRHTKSQQINGSQALALPKSTFFVQEVHMSDSEKDAYKRALQKKQSMLHKMAGKSECKWFHLRNSLMYSLMGPLNSSQSSKLKALESAILDLRSRDPDCRIVVFTQFRDVLQQVKDTVTRISIPLYCFDGSTGAKYRDNSIRNFQSTSLQGPAVFAITLMTGSVGITLTAASHVFLMEPCVDPATEIQAAGRIHRLGQTKPVAVTKFIYRKTVERNILTLHKKIEAGKIHFSATGIKNDAIKVLLDGHVGQDSKLFL